MNCFAFFAVTRQLIEEKLSYHARRMPLYALLFLIFSFLGLASTQASAQSASFVSFQRILSVAPTVFDEPAAVRLNSAGDLFVADQNANKIYEFVPQSDGSFTTVNVATLTGVSGLTVDLSGNVYATVSSTGFIYLITPNGGGYNAPVKINVAFTSPVGITVDSSLNLYVADYGVPAVYKLTPSGGSYTTTTIGSGWSFPIDVALDTYGNLYVADGNNGYLVKETYSGGSYTQSNIGNGDFNEAEGVAVDAIGNVYVSDTGSGKIFKLQPIHNGNYLESAFVSNLTEPTSGAVDSLGNFYYADFGNQTLNEVASNFGSVAVTDTNRYNNRVSANFLFNSTATLGGYLATVNGNSSADYYALGTGSCITAHTYNSGDLCSVDVGFKPTAPGTRNGSIQLTNSSGNVISTAGYFTGFGYGPRAGLLPGTWNRLATGIPQTNYAGSIVTDGNGYVYTVASNNAYVTKDGGTTWTQVFNGSVHHATAVVVDGGGNAFVSTIDGLVFVCVASGGVYSQTQVLNEGDTIEWMAIDAGGNLYMIDQDQDLLEEAYLNNGSFTLYTLFDFFTFDSNALPEGVAVDLYGNVFVSDYFFGVIYAWAPVSNGSYNFYEAVRGLDTPLGIVTDPSGNLIINDSGRDTGVPTIYRADISNIATGFYSTSYDLFPLASTIPSYPVDAIGTDAAGNIYVTDNDPNGSIYQVNITSPKSLTFNSANVGIISTDSPQTVFLTNTGNSALTIYTPGSGQNPSISTNFLLNSGGVEYYPGYATALNDCPIVLAGGTAQSIAAEVTCALPISFQPTAAGPITGEVVIGDDSLYTDSEQFVLLNGTGLPSNTTTTVSSSLNPSNYGVQVTLTAVVAQQSGTETPVGTVQFFLNGNLLGTTQTLVSGVASYTSNTLPAGNDQIVAIYTPSSANFAGSTSNTLTQVVNVDVPTITITSSVNPAYEGQSVTFTMNVAQTFGTIIPTGTIQLTSNGTNIGVPLNLSNGQVSYTTTTLPAGSDTIVAHFTSTNTSINSGTATVVEVVDQNIPQIILTSSVNPSVAGQLVTFNVAVTQTQGALIPTGQVQFSVNGAVLGAPVTLVNGTASISSSSLPNGTDTIVAAYTSNSVNFANGTQSLVQVVNINVPVISLTSSLNPSNFGVDVTLTASVAQAVGAPVPSGTLQLILNGNPLTTPVPLVNGGMSITSNTLPAGTDVITAIYTSDTQDYASGTKTLTQTVNIDNPSITLTSSLNPSTYGQPITFSVVVGQVAGSIQPQGTVQFFGNGTPLTIPTLLIDGVASFSTSTLTAGTWNISVVFSSTSPNFVSGTSTITQIVNKVTPVVTLAVSANSIFVSNPVTLVGNVTGYATNVGTLTFYDGTTVLWTGSPNSNGVELVLPSLAVGAHALSVVYSGNANVSAGTSTTVTENVDDFTIVLATGPTKPISSGQSATYTFTVTPVGPLTTMPADINLVLTGAPPESTVSITSNALNNPVTPVVTAGSGTTTVTVIVATSKGLVMGVPQQRPGTKWPAPIALALLLLPIAARLRKNCRKLMRYAAIAIFGFVGVVSIVTLSGCGQSLIPKWDMTLTATSGALQHSADISLRVQ